MHVSDVEPSVGEYVPAMHCAGQYTSDSQRYHKKETCIDTCAHGHTCIHVHMVLNMFQVRTTQASTCQIHENTFKKNVLFQGEVCMVVKHAYIHVHMVLNMFPPRTAQASTHQIHENTIQTKTCVVSGRLIREVCMVRLTKKKEKETCVHTHMHTCTYAYTYVRVHSEKCT